MDDIMQAPQPEEVQTPETPQRVTVCDIQFRSGSKIYYFDPDQLELKSGDHVIIDTARGAEYGYCVQGNHRVAPREVVQPLRKVLRLATERDEAIHEDNLHKEKKASDFCQRKIGELGLEMQLVSAESAFDGSKLLFFFTADGRVDFRELVKILASAFHTRIELRQIGVRDKAKMVGGLGICGRPFCCAQFLQDFQPVSIKMAKTQNLSLNPTKISGTCGRLMCCLKYEQEAYEDLIKTSPKADSFVDTPDGRGTVTAVNLMRQSVNVRMEHDPEEIHCYKNCDICVLRNGKGKKTDPPIPDDLAPISGGREKKEEELYPRFERRLEPEQPVKEEGEQKNRRRRAKERAAEEEPAAVQEQPKPEKAPKSKKEKAPKKESQPKKELPKPEHAAQENAAEPEKPGRSRRRRGKKPQPEAQSDDSQSAQQPKPEPKSRPKAAPKLQPDDAKAQTPTDPAQAQEGSQKPKSRRRYYHHRPKSGSKS